MRYWKSLLLGATTFAVAHVIEARNWEWFGGSTYRSPHSVWFVATPLAMLFTTSCMAITALIVGALSRERFGDLYVRAFNMMVGAFIVSVITLFIQPDGPGNLFPLALVVGAFLLFVGTTVGVAVGWAVGRLLRRLNG